MSKVSGMVRTFAGIVAVLALTSAPAAAQSNGTITGTVFDAITMAPITGGVPVRLYSATGARILDYPVNGLGVYDIHVAPGTYYIGTAFLPQQYVPMLHGGIPCVAVDCRPTLGTPVTVVAATVTTVDLPQTHGGAIAGTVRRASDNSPVNGFRVYLYNASTSLVRSVPVAVDGTYAFFGLPAGSYFALASILDDPSAPVRPSMIAYIPELYGGVHCSYAVAADCRIGTGTPVTATHGVTTAGIDFLLDEGGRISGRVLEEGTNAPLAGLQIKAFAGVTEVASAMAGGDGSYSLFGLPPGAYRLRTMPFGSSGYVQEWHDGRCVGCPGTSPAIAVAAGATVSGVDFALAPGGAISGALTCPGGGTTAMPSIDAYSSTGVLIGRSRITGTFGPPPTFPFACTNHTYVIEGLPPDQYYLLAQDTPADPFNPFFASGGFLINTVYGGIDCITVDCDVRRGVPVPVAAGGSTTGIDFAMRFGSSVGLRMDNGSSPRQVTAYDSRGVELTSVVFVTTFGSWSLVGLPAGTYFVKLDGVLYRDLACPACPPTAGTPIIVPDTTSITVQAAATQTVSGTVRAATGGAPLSTIGVELVSSAAIVIGSAVTDAGGVYAIAGVPAGTYFARTRNTRGYVDELFSEHACPTCDPRNGTPIVVSAGPVSGIDFTLAASGTITGMVAETTGVFLANVPVSLFDPGGAFVARTASSAEGRYAFEVAPGSYRARAEPSPTHAAELFDGLACTSGACDVTTGTPIAVTSGARTAGVNFSLASCSAMTIMPPHLAVGVAGRSYRQVFSVTGGTGPMRFGVTVGTLPVGLTLDPATGLLAGTIETAGRHQVTIGAVDAAGCATSRALTLDVQSCAFTLSPSSATVPAAGGTVEITITDPCGSQTVSINFAGVTVQSQTPNQVTLAVAANPAAVSRAFTVLIGRRVFVINQGGLSAQPPFGSLDGPADGAQVSGSVGVGGWALDDLQVRRVFIVRDPVGGEGASQIHLGDAVFVPGARPDVRAAYRSLPNSDRAGWGFLILTNMLPNQGTGAYRIHAYAEDVEGLQTLLGSRTIVGVNSTSAAPFGAIDTPAQGATISGAAYINFGWALTPQPKIIPFDGSTIHVLVDGLSVGSPTYNQLRADIAALFPGLANSNGAVGFRAIDTTALAEGLHTIAWYVSDNQGAAAGIGSRYFTVSNSADGPVQAAAAGAEAGRREESVSALPVVESTPLGSRHVRMRALDRLELHLGEAGAAATALDRASACEATWAGYAVDEKTLAALPVGATIDPAGTFYWQPGPGFKGVFELLFVRTGCDGRKERIPVRVTIDK
jgi:hypothetical protein